jgi:hypothetical protein
MRKALRLFLSTFVGFLVGSGMQVCKLYLAAFSSGVSGLEAAAIIAGIASLALLAWAWFFRGGAYIPVVGFVAGFFGLTLALFPLTFWICGGHASGMH